MSMNIDYIEIEQRLSRMVSGTLNNKKIDSAFITELLQDLPSTRLYTRYADDPDWLSWLDARKVLDSLFDVQVKLSETEIELSRWIVNRFVITHQNYVLQLIHNHGGTINSTFWHWIIDEVVFHRDKKDRPASDILDIWVTVLLNNAPRGDIEASRFLGYLLERCEWPENRYSIIAIFSHLLRPIPVSDRDISLFTAKEVEFEYAFKIETTGDEYSLNEAWTKFVKHLPDFWRSLLPTVQKYLTDAHELNKAFGNSYDAQSSWRSAIKRHEQDEGIHRAFDILIDIARDILEYLLSQDELKQEAIALVKSWFASEVPLLNRLAIHGRAIGSCWSSDEKITWLLKNDLIFNRVRNYKHEIFYVIELALPDASPEVVAKLIDVVLNKETDDSEGSDEEKSVRPYERYNLLYWMTQKAPKSKEVQSAYDNFSETHPNFIPREYPDFDVWTSGVHLIEPDSPINVKELVEKSLKDATKLLVEHKGKHQYSDDDDRRGLLDVLTAAVNGNFNWSMQLAAYLIENDQLKSDIWYYLIRGWTQTLLSKEKWETVLEFLIVNSKIHRKTQSACDLLENVVKKETEISDSILTKMEHLSDVIWQELEQIPEKEPYESNWLTKAINHGSGKLCEFWLQALHKRKHQSGGQWTIIPDDYRKRFEKVVEGESYAAQLARSVLASRSHYLFFMDKSWVSKKLIPLFNYDSSQIAADQAWHGYLVWGQLRMELNELLKPFYIQAINHLTETRDGLRKKLFSNIIDTMLMDTDSKPDIDWFYSALSQAGTTDEDRQEVLIRIWATLRDTDDGFKNSLWTRWFKKFWADRISGIPVSLSPSESNKMLELLPWLAPVFEEAVDLALKIHNFEFQYTHLYSDFSESKLVASHPKEMTKLLVHLLNESGESTNQGRYLVTLYEKLSKELNDSDLRELKNNLVRLGVITAVKPNDDAQTLEKE